MPASDPAPRPPDGRFAPSPSGPLHLGNLRTALLAWLFARSAGARFLVRIEDLDAARTRPGAAAAQLADLTALGLDWDGEVVRQSQRGELYRAALDRLAADDLLYPCYCTRAEIREAASAPHGPVPGGAYPGTCRSLSARERSQRERAGRRPALRLRADRVLVRWTDRLLGPQVGGVDDFVVQRNDGVPAYNLAVVVDDGDQGIGEVVRGADLASSTPRQVLAWRLLGLREPAWAHVPLILGPDGARLAKRHGAVTLSERAVLGQSAEDVLDELAATLGLAERGERPTARVLLDRFSPADLPSEPTMLARPGAADRGDGGI